MRRGNIDHVSITSYQARIKSGGLNGRTQRRTMDYVMSREDLQLPSRPEKPRPEGVTMAIDGGLPLNYFTDLVESSGEFFDFMKFGWGTSVVTKSTKEKIDVLNSERINYYFGGTLFEKYVLQGKLDDFRRMCQGYGCQFVEVSNGTVDISDERKAEFVAVLSQDFRVISEVGSKIQAKSDTMAPNIWIHSIEADIDAGAVLVTLETRESGHGGICRSNGELRYGLIEEIISSGVDANRLLFEAPSTELQSYFVGRVGPNVNVGNVAPSDIIGLETLRLGLRSETLLTFEPEGRGVFEVDA
jgi:phosphosulfolactate synthase